MLYVRNMVCTRYVATFNLLLHRYVRYLRTSGLLQVNHQSHSVNFSLVLHCQFGSAGSTIDSFLLKMQKIQRPE